MEAARAAPVTGASNERAAPSGNESVGMAAVLNP